MTVGRFLDSDEPKSAWRDGLLQRKFSCRIVYSQVLGKTCSGKAQTTKPKTVTSKYRDTASLFHVRVRATA